VRVHKFDAQYGGGDPQQLAAVIEVELGRDLPEQPVAFHGQRTGCRIQLGPLKIIGDALQQAYLTAGKEGKQVFKTQREASKDHLAAIGGTDSTADSPVEHEHISRRKPLIQRSAEAFAGASHGEHKRKPALFIDPFFRGFEANQPQSQIIMRQHSIPPLRFYFLDGAAPKLSRASSSSECFN
jgi:hypothetical protein